MPLSSLEIALILAPPIIAVLLAGLVYSAIIVLLSRRVRPLTLFGIWFLTSMALFLVFVGTLLGFGDFALEVLGVWTVPAFLLGLTLIPLGLPTLVAWRRAEREPRAATVVDILLVFLSFPPGVILGATVAMIPDFLTVVSA